MNQTTQLQRTGVGGEPPTHTSRGAVVGTAAPRSTAGRHGGGGTTPHPGPHTKDGDAAALSSRQPPPRSWEHAGPPHSVPLPSQPHGSRKLWELGSNSTLAAYRRALDSFLPHRWSLRPGQGARPKGEGPRLWLPQAPTEAEWAGGALMVANKGALGGTSHLCPHQETKNEQNNSEDINDINELNSIIIHYPTGI